MKTWPIWMEGFHVMEGVCHAKYCGEWPGDTFAAACAAWAAQEDPGPCYQGMQLYDKARNTWWGCRLFDNERDARAIFG